MFCTVFTVCTLLNVEGGDLMHALLILNLSAQHGSCCLLRSDYMEKCLDPAEGDLTDIHYASTTLTAEVKRESTHHLLGDQLKQMHQKTVSAGST